MSFNPRLEAGHGIWREKELQKKAEHQELNLVIATFLKSYCGFHRVYIRLISNRVFFACEI